MVLHILSAAVVAASDSYDVSLALQRSQAAIGRPLVEVTFTDPQGRSVALASLRGKPLIISLVYTSCYQICSVATSYLATVVAKARQALGSDSFNVVTIGFDTSFDTPAAMRAFANQQNIGDDNWLVLSMDRDTAALLLENLGFSAFPSPRGYDHLVQATLVDDSGIISQQIYGEVFDIPLLIDPLKALLLGQPLPQVPFLERVTRRLRLVCTTYDP
ncbi:MAG: SCO family protein, partial [Magnetococcales bacterium]|nr:SCO family protein [Magnetococcales bacterium]